MTAYEAIYYQFTDRFRVRCGEKASSSSSSPLYHRHHHHHHHPEHTTSHMSFSRPPFWLTALVVLLFVANLFSQVPTSTCVKSNLNEFVATNKTAQEGSKNASSTQPNSQQMLPKKLFVIYGLESSGTTFIAKTVATALNIRGSLNPDTVESRDRAIHIQHLSLPLGGVGKLNWGFETRFTEPLTVVPVYFPTGCREPPFNNKTPGFTPVQPRCREIFGDQVMTTPHRYFVNITSHVLWYRERGVEVHPIMVVRDPSLHFEGILIPSGHCPNTTTAFQQYEMGREIMTHSIPAVNPTIVSYETLMTLKEDYLRKIYKKLNIETAYMPIFKNGNLKHIKYSGEENIVTNKLKAEEARDRPVTGDRPHLGPTPRAVYRNGTVV
jgi:hypothetical protein